ncbi:MAG: hypothetical protein EAZ85_11455, partial [Bacteroidetes bacterium]
LDFIATIKTENGERKKILIEVQKAKNLVDLMRFRNYLAEQYKKEDIVDGQNLVLPITTIYILGFDLEGIQSPCIKIERNYKDLLKNKNINEKHEFIEKLTHDSFVVQVNKITNSYQTKLEKLLSIFEQKHFFDDNKIVKDFKHNISGDENMKITTDILHFTGTSETEREELLKEQEAMRTINSYFQENRKKLIQQEKMLEESKKALEQKSTR